MGVIEYDTLRATLKNLEAQFANYCAIDDDMPALMQEAIAESVIQRFELCYECIWKILKRYLIGELGISDAPNSPKPIFRIANENNLFAVPIERWMEYAEARTNTTHNYDPEKATAALALMRNFIDDAIDLYQTMTGKTWE